MYNLLTSQLKLLDNNNNNNILFYSANIQFNKNLFSEWRKRLLNKSQIDIINLHEELAKGYDSLWTTWRCLNRLRTGYTCSKAQSGRSTQVYEYLYFGNIYDMAMKSNFIIYVPGNRKLWLLPLALRLPNYIYITSMIDTSRLMLIKIK